ncbi:DUF3089 domain-containing protein [Altererythrobacter lutimaris]|uniref:DUF3089 domain-containing protein n=1 Tax=Altererythrobacter lutimaris TaxID=2743979 RepID=A0A850H5P6_9SPHN|nr:DUF3089 domain-containing protein [Altererythrobacter lutimaris]NVE94534.1 DUF3089 domain-containing protein [Altererythrobacter lutimaris]
MAKKFLGCVAILIVLFIGGAILLTAFSREATEFVFVPSAEFEEQAALETSAYADLDLWYSHPDKTGEDPARYQPPAADEGRTLPSPADPAPGDFAVFFVHPTSYLDKSNWNAPLGDKQAEDVARTYLRGMASPFNQASAIWAPRYRQATLGAFLTDKPEGQQAIDAAYADVALAYDQFIAQVSPDTPIVLAGHSQGALHLKRLLQEKVAGSPAEERLVAAYAIGWPISLTRDLPLLGFPVCTEPDSTGCILSWSSYAEPADPSDVMETYSASIGLDGQPRGDSTILCTNPLTGRAGGEADASLNLGTLVPEDSLDNGELVARAVPARCDERGLLLIGDPPQMGSFVLPGNNYHVYDIPLFWANTKQDVAMRVDAWLQSR